MALANSLHGKFRRFAAPRQRPHRPPARRRLFVEGLEDRLVLSYNFTNISAPLGTEVRNFVASPSFNSEGRVAFTAVLRNGPMATYYGDGGKLTLVIDTETGPCVELTPGVINVRNQVVLNCTLPDAEQQLLRVDPDGTIVVLADTSKGYFSNLTFSRRINDDGIVAFRANLVDGRHAIYTTDGVQLTEIAVTGDTFSSFGDTMPNGPDINAAGDVAFLADLTAGGTGVFLYRVQDAQIVTVIDTDTAGGYFQTFRMENQGRAAVNDYQTVLFNGRRPTGELGLYTCEAQHMPCNPKTITTIVTTGGDSPFTGIGTNPGLNNWGQVAFRGVLPKSVQGIFTGPNLETDTVLLTGTPLFGDTANAFGFFDAINDAGQIAFRVDLNSGNYAIVRADPERGGSPGRPGNFPGEVAALVSSPGDTFRVAVVPLAGVEFTERTQPVRREPERGLDKGDLSSTARTGYLGQGVRTATDMLFATLGKLPGSGEW